MGCKMRAVLALLSGTAHGWCLAQCSRSGLYNASSDPAEDSLTSSAAQQAFQAISIFITFPYTFLILYLCIFNCIPGPSPPPSHLQFVLGSPISVLQQRCLPLLGHRSLPLQPDLGSGFEWDPPAVVPGQHSPPTEVSLHCIQTPEQNSLGTG